MRVALVHDYLNEMGGAERVVEALTKMFPNAPLYTSVYDAEAVGDYFSKVDVRTSYLQRFATKKAITKLTFALLPSVFARFELRGYDVILSSSSGFAHHVRPSEGIHICYCYTPPRFLWQPTAYFMHDPLLRSLIEPALRALRRRDKAAAANVDVYVAISREVARRISDTYGRDAVVIHPPVDTSQFEPSPERSGRFLVVSRLLSYKRIDLAIEAAERGGFALDVIGDGPEKRRLETKAGKNVRLLGRQSDAVVRKAMATCEALILPGSEDFGLAVIEAQASGRPVIAFASGGALETVSEGVSGYFFARQESSPLADAMGRVRTEPLDGQTIIAWARQFDVSAFERKLYALAAESLMRVR